MEMMKPTQEVNYVIFPYLKTAEMIRVGGVTLWPSQNIEENDLLTLQHKEHLNTLFSLFYIKGSSCIPKMMYALWDIKSEPNRSKILQNLQDTRTLLGYFYSSPGSADREPFLAFENANYYVFRPAQVSRLLVEEVSDDETQGTTVADNLLDGYEGILNLHSHLWVTESSKIYPPVPNLILNKNQDVFNDLDYQIHNEENWPLRWLLNGRQLKDEAAQNRIFTAMEWYNRSCLASVTEDVALLHLAVAFESLFELEEGNAVTNRFIDFLLSLLGKNLHLKTWAEQFYDARSRIVHQGSWPHLYFYAVDNLQSYQGILKGKREVKFPLKSGQVEKRQRL